MPRLIRFTVSCACIRAQGHTLVRNPGVESGFPDQISYHVTLVPTKKRLMPQVPYHVTSNRLWISIFCVNVHISAIGMNKAMKRWMKSKGKLTNLSISRCAIIGANIRVCAMADYSASFKSRLGKILLQGWGQYQR